MRPTALPALLSLTRVLLGPAYVLALSLVLPHGASGSPGAVLPGPAAQGSAATAGASAGWLAALPLLLAGLASLTDFADGRLARRLGSASPAGAVLDVAADAAFLLVALSALAAAGLVSWLLPIAAGLSLAALARQWPSRTPANPRRAAPQTAADRLGHLAGVLNFSAVLVASGVPLGLVAAAWLPAASRALALLNLAPLALRALRAR